jgi:EAL domain-containing protein (putative c-di-GMP-specific phosphodiesterase class I)
MFPLTTLNLSIREQQAHNAELLTLIRDRGARPVTLADLFGGMEPRWAVEAAERLQIAGAVREVKGRLLAS